jgi:hypothetical protein
MQRSFGWSALAGALLAQATPASAEDRLPVTVAPGIVAPEPKVSIGDFKGHKTWSISWPRNAQGHQLHVGFVEGLELPYREQPPQLLKLMHDKSSDDEADLRQHTVGRSEQIWDLDVFWLAGSERSVMYPSPATPEAMKDVTLHRGDTRRNCAVFTANPPGPTTTLVGAYCRDLAPDVAVDEATFRQWLEALDLKVRQ